MEARRDHELVRHAARGHRAFQLGERRVNVFRHRLAVEELMELVVERADPLRQRHVLGHVREVARVLGRAVERAHEVCDDLIRPGDAVVSVLAQAVDPCAEHDDEPAGEHCRDHVGQVVVGDVRHRCALEALLLAQDRAVQPLERRARLDPELVDERPASIEIRLERLRLPSGAIEREHQLPA